MANNIGKKFENDFKKQIQKSGIWINRYKDGTSSWDGGNARFQSHNICDYEVFHRRILFLLELKTHAGKSIPHNAIREKQFEELDKAEDTPYICAGYLVLFQDHDRCFFLDAKTAYAHWKTSGRKSIPMDFFEKYGREIEVRKIRTNYRIDTSFVRKLADKVEEYDGNLPKSFCVFTG